MTRKQGPSALMDPQEVVLHERRRALLDGLSLTVRECRAEQRVVTREMMVIKDSL
jgi:hypothetical protein